MVGGQMVTKTQKETLENKDVDASITLRTFRSSPELESFYRFIYDNKLRREAKAGLDFVFSKIKVNKKRTRRKRTKNKTKVLQ